MDQMKWKLAYEHDEKCRESELSTIEQIEASGFEILPATVPGNLELELMRAGKLEDLYFSVNTLAAQKLEDVHAWYFTTVKVVEPGQFLRFEGIDTFADIYVNGRLVKSTDNMHLAYDVAVDWKRGENEIVVHIKPTMLEARKYPLPVSCYAQKYNYPSLYVRKAAHMFGWDIMPRIVSVGLWKDVSLKTKKIDRINEAYLMTSKVDTDNRTASLRFYVNTTLSGSFAMDYSVRIEGRCGDSVFIREEKLWHNTAFFNFDLENCRFWWPKRAGKADLYDVTVSLLYKGEVCDCHTFRTGIRTIALDRTEMTDENYSGEFCFKVNGKKIFVLGTNWVPLDAFHSNDKMRLSRALELLDDIGCNMVRCWGGNVYETDEFFDYCDEHGILVWQDFAMGCGVYPDDELFSKKMAEEAAFQIKRLRHHASLALWAGDNECDVFCAGESGGRRDPNRNGVTRNVLRHMVELHDYVRPYLPSSPYISEAVYNGNGIMPEEHLWGPRNYFKGDYYKNSVCHFASETGYHGFNSPRSLKKFLREPEKIFHEDGTPTDEYLVHAACMEADMRSPYAYRIRLAYDQVVTLFGAAEDNLEDFVRQSQISQAEAKKYFIEKFRINKWQRTGIIWWNLLDGWPQVSDAVVDYYFTKKLAYHYIKRSQEPVCLMFDEPENGMMRLVGVNDLPEDINIEYRVRRMKATTADDGATEGKRADHCVLEGHSLLPADSSTGIDLLAVADGEQEFYLIEWNYRGQQFKNHYFTNLLNIDYRKYLNRLEQCKMAEFEGFEHDRD